MEKLKEVWTKYKTTICITAGALVLGIGYLIFGNKGKKSSNRR